MSVPPADPRRTFPARAPAGGPAGAARTEPAAAPDAPPSTAIELGGGAWLARDDAKWAFSRSGGPGGQNVNKISSRSELRVHPSALRGLDVQAVDRLRALAASRLDAAGCIVVVRDESRSQLDNREACVALLRDLVAQARVIPKRRRKTKPTKGSKLRRLEGKRREGDKKRGRRGGAGEE